MKSYTLPQAGWPANTLASLQSPQCLTGRISGRRARVMAQRLVRQQLEINVSTGAS